MKKLGKKVVGTKGTLMAYACSCGSCPCATSQCTCKNNPAATHRNALTTSSNTSYNMQYTALGIGG
ncbi:CLI_3235 family bacteriocin precursor [Paenibacillus albidus]|uniref:CLI_3235 family bacteriocin precursor n=1 Tax=Paenibacillus albidus TaxID=2041023 RepID=UPI001BEB1A16|nr:CLI_3235 family bacteriocin precursor [Paenibacillus albidus]